MNKNIGAILLFLILTPITVLLSKTLFVNTNFSDDIAIVGDYTSFGVNAESPIIIYTVEWCNACSSLKKYLIGKGIKFKNMDVEKDVDALEQFNLLKGDSYPVILIADTRINGFHKFELDKQIKKISYIK